MVFAVALMAPFLVGAGKSTPKVGVAAPEFTLTTFAKRKVRLSELRGKVVIINYWATWCAPCKAEMPMMHDYFRKNQARGLEMFGVTTQDSVPPYRLKKVSAVLSYPLAARINGNYGAIGNAVPSTYIIDRKGVVRVARAGAFTATEFKSAVDPLLAEAP
ncbi:MAG: TlpA family protein disulfide reductase [Proteobacteria bacterium]|nr:TlpA family protein disulfide reductase [Pseudomonadota bacterium]